MQLLQFGFDLLLHKVKNMRELLCTILFAFSCTVILAQGNSGIDIAIENVQFPDSVTINETAIVTGYLKNKGQAPYIGNILLNFDIEDEMPIDFDIDSETDEVENMPNSIVMPGDSMYFQRAFIIDPTRFNDKTIDLIVIWPTLVEPDDNIANDRKILSFYVEEADAVEDEDEAKNVPNGNAYGHNNGNAYGHNNGNNGNGKGGGRLSGFGDGAEFNEIVNSLVSMNNYLQIQMHKNFVIQQIEVFDINGRLVKNDAVNVNSLQLNLPNRNQIHIFRFSVLNTELQLTGEIVIKQ